MNKSSKNNIPWELIAESLTGSLSAEGELRLQQWISSDDENKQKYLQIMELWKTGIDDYKFYKAADEEKSWKSLQEKMTKNIPENKNTPVVRGQFGERRKLIRNLIAIAAVFIVIIGIGFLIMLPKNAPLIYETANNVQITVTLADGSSFTLKPNTRIEVPAAFNRPDRTIKMQAGEAWFNVIHSAGKPFIVELGPTQVKDIGTSFSIRRKPNSIDVVVTKGKIAFVKLSTRETRELNAGSAITYHLKSESFGLLSEADSLKSGGRSLNFENTPLAEIIITVQKIYGKKILIDNDISDKTFTGELDGMSYTSVIQVLCKSLGLEYSVNDSIYRLKAKTIEQP